MSDILRELAKPFPPKFVKKPPKGKYGEYVSHDVVTQKLLATIGPFDMELVQEIRGLASEIKTDKKTYPAVENALVGIWLRCTFHVDGRSVSITEAGNVEQPAMKETDGDRAKDAISDAIKRCAMRLGVGLHLWSGQDFILYDQLSKTSEGGDISASARPSQPSTTQTGGDAGADVSDQAGDSRVWGSARSESAGTDEEPGSAPRDAEPQGEGEAQAELSLSPATDLVATYGTKKVLLTAREVAKNIAIEQPLSVDQIDESLAVLVGKELEKQPA